MNPNISIEKITDGQDQFTITEIGTGSYLVPGPGVLIPYEGSNYVITDAERLETKPPSWKVTATLHNEITSTVIETDPTKFTQLITPNPNISCTPGECLVYVRETFGINPHYPTATDCWNASTRKHQDHYFPDAWVPVWFSLNDEPAGHVALRQPDGSIWSSSDPTATTPVHHNSLADMEQYFNQRLFYLGWTEDIEDELVVGIAAN